LLMSCLTHSLICFGLYVFLLRFFEKRASATGAIAATFLTRSPQWVIRWGGNPTVLALFFFIIAFSLIIELRGKASWPKMTLASLFLAATLITHSIVFYIGGIVLVVYFLMSFNDHKDLLASSIGLFIIMLVLLVPYLIDLKFTLTKTAIESTRAWQMADASSVIYDLIAGIPFLMLSAFGLPALFKKNRKVAIIFLAITTAMVLLTINYRFWFMPFSYLLYPGRVVLAFIIPLAVFACPAIEKIATMQKKHLLAIFTAIGLIFYCAFYLFNSISMCSVTQADLDAFRWMDTTISKKAVIINNYGDAGLWIPAIIGRTITNPHSEPIHFEELKAGLSKLKADYVYIGSKAVYGIDYKKEDLEKKPWKYRIVYNKDGAQLWKIL